MKLFKKIFLQVFVGCLLLSQIPFLYFLYESQRQSLKDTVAYEQKNFYLSCASFQSNLSQKCAGEKAEEIWKLAAVSEFRALFGSSGALYYSGEELFNSSPYEFDWEGIRESGTNNDTAVSLWKGIAYPGVTQHTVNDRKLLVFSGAEKMPAYMTDSGSFDYGVLYYTDVTDIYQRTETLLLKGVCFTLALLAVIGVVLFVGIYRSIYPLQELRVAAASIAGGDYESRVPVRGKDEIAELAENFNQMAQSVEEHVEQLFHINEEQRRLIGSLAHELKTPMTAIIGYSDTLLTVGLSEKRRVLALNYIRSEGRRLSRLASKMMELTGLYESGDSVSIKEKNVAGLFRRLKDLTAYRLKEKDIRLETRCSPPRLTLPMDEDLMMSLLMNLVDNAFKASPEHSFITVSADEKGITVEDRGKGIPEADIARVTEAFYMVDKSRSKNSGSVGLGLAVCKQIADLHGARLVIESEEGKYTRVTVAWHGGLSVQGHGS